MTMNKLGAISRPLDLRDLKLGKVQPPISRPKVYQTDISHLDPIYQNSWPACGAHAGAHLKSILDASLEGLRYQPSASYLWKKIKAIDQWKPEDGTDMRSIFKALQTRGVCDYDLSPNPYGDNLANYTLNNTTAKQDINAHPRIIEAYGFGKTDHESIRQAIWQNKAVLLLINIGDTWWRRVNIYPYNRYDGGHFVVAYGYDDNYIEIIDSADRYRPIKSLDASYPIREVGTAIDVPNEVVKNLIKQKELLQKVVSLYQQLIRSKK